MTIPDWLLPLLGFTSPLWGHVLVGLAVNPLWDIAKKDLARQGISKDTPIRSSKAVAFWHGVTEPAFYFGCVVFGRPEGIAVWIAFKAVIRWQINENDERHLSGGPIYMIGTALNVGVSVAGGLMVLNRWTL